MGLSPNRRQAEYSKLMYGAGALRAPRPTSPCLFRARYFKSNLQTMLIRYQIPIADLRLFRGEGRLAAPGFPAPIPNEEFIRSAGVVRARPSSDLSGWIAESHHCEGRNAVRIYLSKLDRQNLPPLGLDVVFRRFHFDGCAVGKFEVSFRCEKKFSRPQFEKLLRSLSTMPVGVLSVPVFSRIRRLLGRLHAGTFAKESKLVSWPLLEAGNAIARFYGRATAAHGSRFAANAICAGAPSIFIDELSSKLAPSDLPKKAKSISLRLSNLRLWHWWETISGRQVRIWVCIYDDVDDESNVDKLALYLLRLNAQSEVFMRVLKAIAENRVAPAPRGPEAQLLQKYLNVTTRNINSVSAKTKQFSDKGRFLAQIASATELIFTNKETLLKRLDDLAIRKNISLKTSDRATAPMPPKNYAPNETTQVHVHIGLFQIIGMRFNFFWNWMANMDLSKKNSSILAFVFGVVFVTALLVVNILIPSPTTSQHETFRIILALAAGGVAAMIPGILDLKVSTGAKFALRAGGALAVFVIVFFYPPGVPPALPK
jgi:hypothetical protein